MADKEIPTSGPGFDVRHWLGNRAGGDAITIFEIGLELQTLRAQAALMLALEAENASLKAALRRAPPAGDVASKDPPIDGDRGK
jgi:hypothetical protein